MRFIRKAAITASLAMLCAVPPALAQAQPEQEQVRAAQQALNRAGYPVGRVDGSWNAKTAQAVRSFQQAHGLEPTGQLDPRTLKALGVTGQASGPSRE